MAEGSKRERRMMKFFQIMDGGAAIEEAARAVKITLQCANKYLHEASRKPREQMEAEKKARDEAFCAAVKDLVDCGFSLNGISRELCADRKRIVRLIDENGWTLTWSRQKPKPIASWPPARTCEAAPAPITGKRSRFDDPIPCRRCWRPFKSWGPGNRICKDCRDKD